MHGFLKLAIVSCLALQARGQDCNHNGVPDPNDISGGPGVWGIAQRISVTGYSSSYALACADLGQDGDADVLYVVYENGSYVLKALVNDGTGRLSTPVTALVAGSGYVRDVASGDFNRDGRIDLAVLRDGAVSLYFGNAQGVFEDAGEFVTEYYTRLLAADFDRDGKPDLVGLATSSVDVFRGDGQGWFYTPRKSPIGTVYASWQDLAVGDFNADGRPDALVLGREGALMLLLGDGTGLLPTCIDLGGLVTGTADSIAAGRFGPDTALDFAVSQQTGTSMFANDGGNTFQFSGRFAPGAHLRSADFDRDGVSDYVGTVTTTSPAQIIVVLHGRPASTDLDHNGIPDDCEDCNGNGIPDAWDIDPNDPDHNGLVSPDCDGNGIPDECEPDCNHNGRADACDIAAGLSADCNHNGIPDECEPDCNGNGVPDDCDIANGTCPDCNHNAIPDGCELYMRDCNRNGIPDDCDIALGTSVDCNHNGVPDECDLTIPVYLGFWQDVYELQYSGGNGWPYEYPGMLALDVDHDGDLDLVLPDLRPIPWGPPVCVIMRNRGDGTFLPPAPGPAAPEHRGPDNMDAADFNGDGFVDVVTIDRESIKVLINRGDGTFHDPVAYGGSGNFIRARDLDGDGDVDLVYACTDSSYPPMGCPSVFGTEAFVRQNFGNGVFAEADSAAHWNSYDVPVSVVVEDLDGNGLPDLAFLTASSYYDTQVTVLRNRSGIFSRDANGNGIPDECELHLGDLDCNGLIDFGDITPFVLALSDPAGYTEAYPFCRIDNGDANQDGRVDFGDITPFVALLTGN